MMDCFIWIEINILATSTGTDGACFLCKYPYILYCGIHRTFKSCAVIRSNNIYTVYAYNKNYPALFPFNVLHFQFIFMPEYKCGWACSSSSAPSFSSSIILLFLFNFFFIIPKMYMVTIQWKKIHRRITRLWICECEKITESFRIINYCVSTHEGLCWLFFSAKNESIHYTHYITFGHIVCLNKLCFCTFCLKTTCALRMATSNLYFSPLVTLANVCYVCVLPAHAFTSIHVWRTDIHCINHYYHNRMLVFSIVPRDDSMSPISP